ncbi:MAG: prepilin-type N-terminal cleavage/methylation domain-containing protein [Rickettsiales bacterium]|nr:prepilin-type N-terminal cleavage/methylation domain-containing protein [Rickettsiales bacterium]
MKKSAFSLVELSVVVVIVTILVAGIFMGGGLVKNARLSNARSHTAKSVVKDMPGLVAWYETTIKDSFNPGETFDNAQITQWRDISPSSKIGLTNQNVLTKLASSAVIYVESGINDIPSIEFDGTAGIDLSAFYQGNSAQQTIFLVFSPSTITTQTLIDADSGTHSIAMQSSNQITLNAGNSATTSTGTYPASFTASDNYIMAVYFDGSNSRVYLNHATNKVGNGNIIPGSSEMTGLTVGSTSAGSSVYTGLISEIIIFNRVIKIQERKDIMSYLSTKYKISVTGL